MNEKGDVRMKMSDILSNPVRMRVIQYLDTHREATTKQIAAGLDDIPAPTLYRHIDRLIKEGILIIKEERKVRGSTERLLTIDTKKWQKEIRSSLTDTAYQFLMSLYMNFREYDSHEGSDPEADRLHLWTTMLELTDEDMDSYLKESTELIKKYQKIGKGGKMRRISLISSPVNDEMK